VTNQREPITLKTERLLLREPTLDDAPALHRTLGDTRTMRYIGDGTGRPLERVVRSIESSMELFRARRMGGFIVERLDTGEVIGDALLLPIPHSGRTPRDPVTGKRDYADFGSRGPHIELGYRLHPDHWGHGFATEAARALFAYATRPPSPDPDGGLGLTHLVGVTHKDNLASQRVLEKAGLTRQGLSEAYYDQEVMLFVWEG